MPASLLRPAPLALCTSWTPSRRHASLSSSRSGVGDAAQHLAAAAPLQCRWPLACRQPAMQLHSRRATLLARCSSSSSSSSSSSHGSGPPPPPPLLPHSSAASAAAWPAAWLQRAFAGAALSAAALLMAARPAAAAPLGGAGSVTPPPMPPPPAAAAAQLTEQQQAQQDGERQQRGWRDTGMLLAAKEGGSKKEAGTNKKAQRENGLVVEKGATSWMSPEEAAAQSNAAVSRLADAKMTEEGAKLLKRQLAPSKGGKLVKDPTKSTVPDPSAIPSAEEFAKNDNFGVVTAWRPEKLKEMTYTQFWNLVRERKVDHARYSHDRRTIYVTTKANAPGGVRTEKVGLPFDPDLYDHLLEHGVFIEDTPINPVMPMLHAVARLVFPIFFSFLLIKFAFRLGRKKKRDKIFGGAKLEVIKAKDATVTFKDIAGIDQVKDEIMEIVSFLRDPQRFLTLGARSPAGVLLVGAPGTGKTLLAKAVAGEAGVPFFSIAGTEFMEMFTGVGASRVRDMFQQARKNAPCILFIDEFDGVGKARSFGGGGNDESVHTINQLLTEMDGFEDNTGVVVMAATNRPSALDKALTRPGRFDRIVHLPLPNVEGRVGILKVHARDKKVDPQLDFHKISRATAGFTGAQLMNLMNQSAILAVRQQQPYISEKEVFEALEKIQRDKMQRGGRGVTGGDNELVPLPMRRSIAVYEAGRALMGYLTPNFDEIQRVSVCPGGGASGYTYFLPREEALESRIVTKGYMEARMVVSMAGRCAERLVLGEGNVSTSGASDIATANRIAREMIFRCGFSKRLGPVSLMTNEENYLKSAGRAVANISTELAIIAYEEVEELVEAAEAKAYYGLAVNYRALTALAKELMEKESMTGAEVRELLEREGVKRFDDTATEGYGWTQDGALNWPGKETKGLQELSEQAAEFLQQQRARELAAAGAGGNGAGSNGSGPAPPTWWAPNNPYTVRTDIADLLGESKDN